MFGLSSPERLTKRLKVVEETLDEVQDDIARLNRLIRSINGRYAIGAKADRSPEQRLLKELLGGDVAAIVDPRNDGEKP